MRWLTDDLVVLTYALKFLEHGARCARNAEERLPLDIDIANVAAREKAQVGRGRGPQKASGCTTTCLFMRFGYWVADKPQASTPRARTASVQHRLY